MQLLCLIWGVLAIFGMLVGFFPLLGATNWLLLPFAGLGFIISLIVFFTAGNRPKGKSLAGWICCLIAITFGSIRLVLGGGVV